MAQDAHDVKALRVDSAFLKKEKFEKFKSLGECEERIDEFIEKVLGR